tara:strand:+ start:6595 stop:7305 length:711 start_codon:yes stop_codon:yes gene_type:complete
MKNILVTGCSKGIGYHIVKNLVRISNVNILAISRDTKGLSQLKKECLQINNLSTIHIMTLDLTNRSSMNSILEYIKINFNNSLDILIHNAASLVNKKFIDFTENDIKYSFNINSFVPFILTQKLIKFFSNNAHVIFISSIGGVQGSQKFPGLSLYSVSKSTLISLTECLSEEYKDHNIAFNCLALGAVQTEMLSKAFPAYEAPVKAEDMGKYIADFAFNGAQLFKGKVIPISLSNP